MGLEGARCIARADSYQPSLIPILYTDWNRKWTSLLKWSVAEVSTSLFRFMCQHSPFCGHWVERNFIFKPEMHTYAHCPWNCVHNSALQWSSNLALHSTEDQCMLIQMCSSILIGKLMLWFVHCMCMSETQVFILCTDRHRSYKFPKSSSDS